VESSLVANNRGRGVVLRSSSSSLQRSVVWSPKFWGVVVRAAWLVARPVAWRCSICCSLPHADQTSPAALLASSWRNVNSRSWLGSRQLDRMSAYLHALSAPTATHGLKA